MVEVPSIAPQVVPMASARSARRARGSLPFTFSITEGIAFGFISYAALKLAAGRAHEVRALVAFFAVAFLLRALFLT
jgi:xanthine/uracil/vitamin C permease (AzgA family)